MQLLFRLFLNLLRLLPFCQQPGIKPALSRINTHLEQLLYGLALQRLSIDPSLPPCLQKWDATSLAEWAARQLNTKPYEINSLKVDMGNAYAETLGLSDSDRLDLIATGEYWQWYIALWLRFDREMLATGEFSRLPLEARWDYYINIHRNGLHGVRPASAVLTASRSGAFSSPRRA